MDIYRFYGVDVAIELLRPGAKWEMYNTTFTRWDDPRPQPTWEEVKETMEKVKKFEESVNTIWLPEQQKKMKDHYDLLKENSAAN